MAENRNTALDVVKGFGIILMVLGHMHFSDSVLNHYIYAFHMPLFFIVSGILYKPYSIRQLIKRRAKALLVPYFVFGAGYCIVYNAAKIILNHSTESLLPTVQSFLLFPTNDLPIETALWFLPVMFLSSVGYACLDKRIGNKTLLSVIIVMLAAVGFILPHVISFLLPFGIESVLAALLFLHFGRMVKEYAVFEKLFVLRDKKQWLFYLCCVILFVVNVLLIFINGKINMRLAKWAIEPLSVFNALTATMLYAVFAKVIVGITKGKSIAVKWLRRISVTSIIYLCTNHVFIRGARFVVTKLMKENLPVLQIILIFVLSMALMYAVAELFFRTKLKVLIGKWETPEKPSSDRLSAEP